MTLTLSYVALVSSASERTADLLQSALGLARTNLTVPGAPGTVPALCVGEAALAFFDPAHPFLGDERRTGVHHIGLTTKGGAARAAERLGEVGLAPRAVEAGLQNRARFVLDRASTCGVRTYLVDPLDLARSASPLIERIDHLGIASADNREAVAVFNGRMGAPVESQQTDMEVQTAVESFTSDKYGAVYHSRAPVIVGGLRVAFLTVGDCDLEFLQNYDPGHAAEIRHGAAGTTRQDQGAIARYVERRGAGLHHVALKSPDINRTLAVLGEAGAKLIDRVGRPGSRRALIGFVHPDTLGGILLHVVQRD